MMFSNCELSYFESMLYRQPRSLLSSNCPSFTFNISTSKTMISLHVCTIINSISHQNTFSYFFQLLCPQVHRSRHDCDHPNSTLPAPSFLQNEGLPAS